MSRQHTFSCIGSNSPGNDCVSMERNRGRHREMQSCPCPGRNSADLFACNAVKIDCVWSELFLADTRHKGDNLNTIVTGQPLFSNGTGRHTTNLRGLEKKKKNVTNNGVVERERHGEGRDIERDQEKNMKKDANGVVLATVPVCRY